MATAASAYSRFASSTTAWAFCEVCSKFGSSKTSVLAEPCRGRNMPRVTMIRRDALVKGYHPYHKVKFRWPRKYTRRLRRFQSPTGRKGDLGEPERGLEQEVDVQLVREEAGDGD